MIEKFVSGVLMNQWMLVLFIALILLLFAEAGYRLGFAKRRHDPDLGNKQSGAIGAILGILGLLLGFSFAMAVGRHDARRSMVTEEANSIGTTWLRADFLPVAHRHEVKSLLERYTRLRLEGFKNADNAKAFIPLLKEVSEIHNELWSHAVAAAAEQPTPLTASFVTSLNETIDLHTLRMAGGRNRVPAAVWLLLLAVTGCGAWSSAFQSGAFGRRSLFSQLVFPGLIAIVITLISDIDNPRKGLVGLNQQPMEELLQSMQP
jgi:hypothetical protein